MNLKRKDKIKLIPRNTFYCYLYVNGQYKMCPFMSYRMTNFGLNFGKMKNEYCKYLRRYLSVNDHCKDCGIGRVENK